jgi:hypothetical protein
MTRTRWCSSAGTATTIRDGQYRAGISQRVPGQGASGREGSLALDNYEVHQVGGQTILEYWIPAEDLGALNASIVGTIMVIAEFH